jgi:hypothetical protein
MPSRAQDRPRQDAVDSRPSGEQGAPDCQTSAATGARGDSAISKRIGSLEPDRHTRVGAALRHTA